jgi:DNA topoisomerase VI subunit B
VAQTGQAIEDWPLVILKELVDNALDAAEEAGIAPEIDINVSTDPGKISIADNGPGIPPQTVRDVLDYSYRVSSREAYASPTRGAQGNALKTLIAMPFALHGKIGTTIIEAQGSRHTITFRVDQLRQEPAINRHLAASPRKKGTSVTVDWPDLLNLDRRGRAFFTNCRGFRLDQPAPADPRRMERCRAGQPRAIQSHLGKMAGV